MSEETIIRCPACKKDIDSDIGEFLSLTGGEPFFECPYCQANLKLSLKVEEVTT